MPSDYQKKKAVLYRMVMPKHTCPFGLKSKDLLEREGFEVEDHYLETREETDAFMREHDVKTTPQTFIGSLRIGGYDELQVHFGKKDPEAELLHGQGESAPVAKRNHRPLFLKPGLLSQLPEKIHVYAYSAGWAAAWGTTELS